MTGNTTAGNATAGDTAAGNTTAGNATAGNTTAGNTTVVVIGGGYAGVMAANRLAGREGVAVTLVNPRAAFVNRIRLHQFVGGTHDGVEEYGKVLAAGVALVVDTVAEIDVAGRRVELTSGDAVPYDYLVYAVGSGSAEARVPGAAEFAYPLGGWEEAERLREAVAAAPVAAPVTVVGGGATGIETAAELAEVGRKVTLVCGDTLGPSLHPRGRRAVAKRLARLGVTVVEGPGAKVAEVTRDAVRLGDGREVASAVTIWTAGFSVPDLAARSGLSTDSLGRLLTDETLTSVDDARVVAAGDAAAPSDLPYRMSCQAAVQLGPQAAETVLSRIAGERPADVEVGFVAQCLSLGRRAGVFQLTDRGDTAKKTYVGGRAGALIKELICKGIPWQLGQEARKPGARQWWTKDAEREQLVATAGARGGEARAIAEQAA
ncbi:FAD-dependent oxidoreductase [Streptomyces sp. P9(2023)]|uniref:NAD(P)/FAD-dependent oxidoreductase n=1 Tax=Streptomyces sp. P9(2023) TaxID=3064394 RepID=UPI0028F45576|nr:FAD-dependent oxidoreductase [Streptomyces sp. P9(2023)]MDT9691841.1 FAD-dependent oxidoreductase [Streptomyces sp. P9(2023)]